MPAFSLHLHTHFFSLLPPPQTLPLPATAHLPTHTTHSQVSGFALGLETPQCVSIPHLPLPSLSPSLVLGEMGRWVGWVETGSDRGSASHGVFGRQVEQWVGMGRWVGMGGFPGSHVPLPPE